MKEKQKYSILSNVSFMLKMAWNKRKSVIWMSLSYALLSVSINVVHLFIGPIVIENVEKLVPLKELLFSICGFSLLLLILNVLLKYIDEIIFFGRVEVRNAIINDINEKACTTSFPNSRNPQILKLQDEAMKSCSNNDTATEHVWRTLTLLMVNIFSIIIYLGILSSINPLLIVIVLATTIIGFFINKHINEWGYRHRKEMESYNKKLSYITKASESTTLAKDIRLFGLGSWLDSIFDSVLNTYEAFIHKREGVYFWACIVDVVLGICRNSIAYVYLVNLVLNNGLTTSEFLLYFSTFSGFTALVTGFLSEFSKLHKESLDLSIVQEYLNLEEEFLFEGGRPIPQAEKYSLKLENVTFTYPGTTREIFKNLTLNIEAGEKLAVVGLNGAGKTTLVHLLCGFYNPDEGRVLLNDIDIREFNRREYYGLFSSVFQDCSDLNLTVGQWVSQQIHDIDISKVKSAIEKAGLSEMVDNFPKGLDTHIGKKVYLDGVELSGGQMQRLMLARALYKDGKILTLDEPTAALDPIAENDIYMKYNHMTEGKTSLFISHRLASTRFCDRIILLHEGRVFEEGSHEELLDLNGEYANLFNIQAQYYREEGDLSV